jgi:TrmH family RNA methyltransferase
MGSFVRVNVWYNDLTSFLEKATVPVYGALLDGKNVFENGRVEEGLLVIGNESKGLSDAVKKMITHPVTIPRMGGAESLNAAVATGIILSHMVQ